MALIINSFFKFAARWTMLNTQFSMPNGTVASRQFPSLPQDGKRNASCPTAMGGGGIVVWFTGVT